MSKDIIYREDAIKAINLRARIPHDVASAHYASMAINAIRSVPSADRSQGEWMHDTSSPIAYRCSACNTLQHWSVIQNGRYHFCPNCGARMKGADDE